MDENAQRRSVLLIAGTRSGFIAVSSELLALDRMRTRRI